MLLRRRDVRQSVLRRSDVLSRDRGRCSLRWDAVSVTASSFAAARAGTAAKSAAERLRTPSNRAAGCLDIGFAAATQSPASDAATARLPTGNAARCRED